MSSWRTGFSSPGVLRRINRAATCCTAPRTQQRHRSVPRNVNRRMLCTRASLHGRTPSSETWISVKGTHIQCLHHSFDTLIPLDHFQRVLSVSFDALTSKTSLLWQESRPFTLLKHKRRYGTRLHCRSSKLSQLQQNRASRLDTGRHALP